MSATTKWKDRRAAGIEIETFADAENASSDLHIFPRETRRGKAQWAIWVAPDGSGVMFIGNDQIVLPKNGPDVSSKNMELKRNASNQLELLA